MRRDATGTALGHEHDASAVPPLDEIAARPELARTLTSDARAAVLALCASVLAALAAPPKPGADAGQRVRDGDSRVGVLTTKQLAQLWQMPESKIRELCRSGTLPARKLGAKEWIIVADALRAWLPNAPLADGVSPGLLSPHDPGRGSPAPSAARPYAIEVRRPARRPQDHGREVGGRDEGHERYDVATPARSVAAGSAGARSAASPPSRDDSPTKGAVT